MATEVNEAVEDTGAITGDEDCSMGDTVERKKKSVIWIFFAVHKEDKSKAICLACNEKVSQGGSNPKNFNTTNLRNTCRVTVTSIRKFCEKVAT